MWETGQLVFYDDFRKKISSRRTGNGYNQKRVEKDSEKWRNWNRQERIETKR